jgi:hypothetical protein
VHMRCLAVAASALSCHSTVHMCSAQQVRHTCCSIAAPGVVAVAQQRFCWLLSCYSCTAAIKTVCCCCCHHFCCRCSERAEDIYRIVALQLGVPLIEVRPLTHSSSKCGSSSQKCNCLNSCIMT